MNDNLFPYQRLDVYRAAMAITVLMHETRIGHSELRDQISRACISIANNLSEGLPNDAPGLRKRYFTTARNSLHELVAAVDIGVAIGAVDPKAKDAFTPTALRLRAMLIGLMRR
jgi:four helix bundle protein